MPIRVQHIEFPTYPDSVPLVSGYLQAYASKDPEIKRSVDFLKVIHVINRPLSDIIPHLARAEVDLFTFSCYSWNTTRTFEAISLIREHNPDALFLLGGPHVANQAVAVLDPGDESVYICNGEGESTFKSFLQQMLCSVPDYGQVGGLSFFRDRTLIETNAAPIIEDVNVIPSPFLSGCFDGRYTHTLLETHRGCPFRCGFCIWGGDHMAKKIRVFDRERVKDELRWISRHNIFVVMLADANWGMQERDVELSRFLAECRREWGFPQYFFYNAAQGKPEMFMTISSILSDAEIVTARPISLQSLDETAIKRCGRMVDKTFRDYDFLRKRLGASGCDWYTEIIWPLPGETLASYKRGLNRMCGDDVPTCIIYPLQILPNTQFEKDRLEHGFEVEQNTRRLVLATKDVSREEYETGIWIRYANIIAWNGWTFRVLVNYLAQQKILTYTDFFQSLVDWLKSKPESAFFELQAESLVDRSYALYAFWGRAMHRVFFSHRNEFESLARDFVQNQYWWSDEGAQICFEIDVLNRPLLYSNKPEVAPIPTLSWAVVRRIDPFVRMARVKAKVKPYLRKYLNLHCSDGPMAETFRINYRGKQRPFSEPRGVDEGYCHSFMSTIRWMLPRWCGEAEEMVEPAIALHSPLGRG